MKTLSTQQVILPPVLAMLQYLLFTIPCLSCCCWDFFIKQLYHPQSEQTSGHLLLKKRFGRCIGGTHPSIKETTRNHTRDHINVNTAIVRVNDFYNIENLGIGCSPHCGGCKCGKSSLGAQNFTIKEEKELHLIESKLEYNKEEKRWIPPNYLIIKGLLWECLC